MWFYWPAPGDPGLWTSLSLSRVLVKCETKPNNQNQMPLTYLCLVFSWVMLIVLHWLNKVSAIFDCEPTKQTGHHNGL